MSWVAPATLDYLKEHFDDWSDLTDVKVFTAPVKQELKGDNIVFIGARGSQEWSALGNQTKEDEFTLPGAVYSQRKQAGEQGAAVVRGRVAEIVSWMEDALRSLVAESGGLTAFAEAVGARQVIALKLATVDLAQGADQDGNRWALAEFDIEVTARI